MSDPETDTPTASEPTTPKPAGEPLPPLPPPTARDGVTLLLGALILLCGVAIGAGGTYLWLSRRSPGRRPNPRMMAGNIAEHIGEQYGLDADQKKKLSEAFEKRLKVLGDIRRKTEQEVAKVHAGLRKDMERILTPEQLKQWSQDFEAKRRRFFRFGGPPGWGGRPGHGPGRRGGRRHGPRRPSFMPRPNGGKSRGGLRPGVQPGTRSDPKAPGSASPAAPRGPSAKPAVPKPPRTDATPPGP